MKGTTNIYNTQPLLNEIENVVKNGLDKILAKYLERYELLERTHKQLMKLPSIREEIDKDSNSDDSDSDDSDYVNEYAPIVNKKQNSDIQRQVENIISYQTNANLDIIKLETKLNSLEKKYAGIYPMLDKILDKIETLNSDVQKMKVVGNIVSAPVPVTLSVASASENIQLEIEEDTEGVEEEESEEEDTEGVEESEESEEEDTEGVEEVVEIAETKTIKINEPVNNANAVCEEVKIVKLESEATVENVVTVESEATVENVEEEEDAEGVEEEEEEDTEGVEEASVETETKSETEDEDEDTESSKEEVVAAAAEDTEGVEEENLEVITIDDVDYCTNDEENGFIWELTEDGEQGDKVGYIKDGEPFFYADEN